jgi:hypothetical protein
MGKPDSFVLYLLGWYERFFKNTVSSLVYILEFELVDPGCCQASYLNPGSWRVWLGLMCCLNPSLPVSVL